MTAVRALRIDPAPSSRRIMDAGVGLSDVMTAMRHAHISTTEEYSRRSGRTKVAGVIGGILKRETA